MRTDILNISVLSDAPKTVKQKYKPEARVSKPHLNRGPSDQQKACARFFSVHKQRTELNVETLFEAPINKNKFCIPLTLDSARAIETSMKHQKLKQSLLKPTKNKGLKLQACGISMRQKLGVIAQKVYGDKKIFAAVDVKEQFITTALHLTQQYYTGKDGKLAMTHASEIQKTLDDTAPEQLEQVSEALQHMKFIKLLDLWSSRLSPEVVNPMETQYSKHLRSNVSEHATMLMLLNREEQKAKAQGGQDVFDTSVVQPLSKNTQQFLKILPGIKEQLSCNDRLIQFKLLDFKLSTRIWNAIARAISKSPVLQLLKLQFCSLNEGDNCKMLFQGLKLNTSIQTLDLRDNDLTCEHSIYILNWCVLKREERDCSHWQQSLRMQAQEHELEGNVIQSQQAVTRLLNQIDNSFMHNNQPQCLQQQSHVLNYERTTQIQGLQKIILRRNNLGDSFAERLARLLVNERYVKSIDISGNKISTHFLKVITKSGMLKNESLVNFDCRLNTGFTQKVERQVAQIIVRNIQTQQSKGTLKLQYLDHSVYSKGVETSKLVQLGLIRLSTRRRKSKNRDLQCTTFNTIVGSVRSSELLAEPVSL